MATENQPVGVFNVGEEGNGMFGLGIPKDLNLFLENQVISQKSTNF
jgi:hypothetical protein